MADFVGSHFVQVVIGAISLFMVVLASVSIDDAIRHHRR